MKKFLSVIVVSAAGFVLALGSATASVESPAGNGQVIGAEFYRWVCAPAGVWVRPYPGGPQTTFLGYGTGVNVADSNDGVWFRIDSPASGYVLAERLCA
jgi:hypothetical protein